jgi:hypothetical protein
MIDVDVLREAILERAAALVVRQAFGEAAGAPSAAPGRDATHPGTIRPSRCWNGA